MIGHEIIIGKYTLESLTNGMYASPLDMYREYIQNAVDSFDVAIAEKIVSWDKLIIDISIDRESGVVIIHDNGLGLSSSKAVPTLLDIGNSDKSRSDFRGFRGIGRLAGLGYCQRLVFSTSFENENVGTDIIFNAKMLRQLLLPGNEESASVREVLERIVTVKTHPEPGKSRFFEVRLEGVSSDDGLTDKNAVSTYLIQHAPLPYSSNFKWGRTVTEKMRIAGFQVPQYRLRLNGIELFKPYKDVFMSDRIKKNWDTIKDIQVETFYRNKKVSAVLWYASTSFYGTVLDDTVKGLRIRQGNILLGDKSSCNSYFKEERFNGWMIGELHILDKELIANSRRDGFEKNKAYYELVEELKKWAVGISKTIRHISYERSLSAPKKAIAEADKVDNVNDLFTEDMMLMDDVNESDAMDQGESFEVAETDFIGKLSLFLNQKKNQTKYTALNINDKLTAEQRKVLERVFDVIQQEYDSNTAEKFINVIASKY